jgi:enoyl-CoA hydratase/carnithine racemase
LRRAIVQAPEDGAAALVLSGSPGLFSAGLDIPVLLQLDRDAMRTFWHGFFGLCAALARSPIPVAAAVTGHSPAGGAVLALFCDYRVMARGEYRIGLNEVQVGLTVPDCIQAALRRLVGVAFAHHGFEEHRLDEPAVLFGFLERALQRSHVVRLDRNDRMFVAEAREVRQVRLALGIRIQRGPLGAAVERALHDQALDRAAGVFRARIGLEFGIDVGDPRGQRH